MNKHYLLIGILLLAGCGEVVRNPFSERVVKSGTACDFNLTQLVELERLQFKIPEIVAMFTPCHAIRISRNTQRDSLGIDVMAVETERNVAILGSAMGFGVSADLHFIGQSSVNTPEQWLISKREAWEKDDRRKNTQLRERKIQREQHYGLDCWRLEVQSFLRKTGTHNTPEISNYGIQYTCWPPGASRYPPITLGAGMRYRDGQPVYPEIDLERDLLSPVFASLELKDLSEAAYAERVRAYEERAEEECRWRLKDVKRRLSSQYNKQYIKPTDEFNAFEIEALQRCGYDTRHLKRAQE